MSTQSLTTPTHVFREYLCENKQFRKTVFACSYGVQIEFFDKKICKIFRDTVPLTSNYGMSKKSNVDLYFLYSYTPLVGDTPKHK